MGPEIKKYWPQIKFALGCGYVVVLWVGAVSGAYTKNPFACIVFLALFALHLLEGGLEKIATAIRTQRNFHIIGDGNDITVACASLYADTVNMRKRGEVQ